MKELEFQKCFEATISELKNIVKNGRVLGNFIVGVYEPLQFIRIDALEPKDYPNGIANNSVFLEFAIDFKECKVELHNEGHIYLSPKDLATPKYKYYAMKSMHDVAVDKGFKKFRKSKFKNEKDLANKISTYYNKIMEYVIEYTGGYPYKQGIEQ